MADRPAGAADHPALLPARHRALAHALPLGVAPLRGRGLDAGARRPADARPAALAGAREVARAGAAHTPARRALCASGGVPPHGRPRLCGGGAGRRHRHRRDRRGGGPPAGARAEGGLRRRELPRRRRAHLRPAGTDDRAARGRRRARRADRGRAGAGAGGRRAPGRAHGRRADRGRPHRRRGRHLVAPAGGLARRGCPARHRARLQCQLQGRDGPHPPPGLLLRPRLRDDAAGLGCGSAERSSSPV